MGQWVFAPRHGLSQLVTSFFASESLGIPHAPLFVPLYFSNRTSSMLAASKGTTFGSPCQLLTVSVNSEEQQRRRSLLLLLCLLAILFLRLLRLQYVNVLVPWWRITDSNR